MRYTKLLFLVLFALSTASAATLYNFSFVSLDNAQIATGLLSADSNGDGSYTAVSGTGTYNGAPITLFANPNGRTPALSPDNVFVYDNQLFPGADPLIDVYGLLFRLNSTTNELNIWSGPYVAVTFEGQGYNGGNPGTFTLTNATPEPATYGLIGAGLIALGLVRRRGV